jgi:hypothetical protein
LGSAVGSRVDRLDPGLIRRLDKDPAERFTIGTGKVDVDHMIQILFKEGMIP